MRLLLLFVFLCVASANAEELILPAITGQSQNPNAANFYAKTQSKPTHKPKLSAADAARIVEKKMSGQIVSVTLQETTPVYVVKILKDGRMKTILIDANSGQFSSSE